jgi:hypothetical protein
MKKAFVTILRSVDYLPGVLVLNHCLRRVGATAELMVLTAPGIPGGTLDLLAALGVKTQRVDGIAAAGGRLTGSRQLSNHYKLAVLSLTQYQKVVYLDADMLVCRNLDGLFEKEKWSAVNAGGVLTRLYPWMDFDSALMVLEPCGAEFEVLRGRAGQPGPGDESHQSYLGRFYPEWYAAGHLHLEPHYNVPATYLDRECALYQYQFGQPAPGPNDVKVIHFCGSHKPWNTPGYHALPGYYGQAFGAWHQCFGEVLAGLPDREERLWRTHRVAGPAAAFSA